MKRIVLAALCGTTLVSVANAADLSPAASPAYTKAPMAVAQVNNWTGFYIGGNVGYGWGDYKATNNNGTASDPFGTATFGLTDSSANGNGFTGGGQIGYNFQAGAVVYGVEADFNYLDSSINLATAPGGIALNASAKTDWFSTVRGRIGYSFGNFMPYVTGGLAIADVKAGVNATVGGLSAGDSQSQTLVGYAVGAGAEYALGGGWSVKGEYLHLGFGSQGYDFSSAIQGAPAAFTPANVTLHTDLKADFDIARIGLNYRFN